MILLPQRCSWWHDGCWGKVDDDVEAANAVTVKMGLLTLPHVGGRSCRNLLMKLGEHDEGFPGQTLSKVLAVLASCCLWSGWSAGSAIGPPSEVCCWLRRRSPQSCHSSWGESWAGTRCLSTSCWSWEWVGWGGCGCSRRWPRRADVVVALMLLLTLVKMATSLVAKTCCLVASARCWWGRCCCARCGSRAGPWCCWSSDGCRWGRWRLELDAPVLLVQKVAAEDAGFREGRRRSLSWWCVLRKVHLYRCCCCCCNCLCLGNCYYRSSSSSPASRFLLLSPPSSLSLLSSSSPSPSWYLPSCCSLSCCPPSWCPVVVVVVVMVVVSSSFIVVPDACPLLSSLSLLLLLTSLWRNTPTDDDDKGVKMGCGESYACWGLRR